MNKVEDILRTYDIKRANLLYAECVDLMNLVSDQELLKIYSDNNEVFKHVINKSKDEILSNYQVMRSVKKILVDYLRSKQLSFDEFEAMTLDDVRDYISKIITTKSPVLFTVINSLENAPRA